MASPFTFWLIASEVQKYVTPLIPVMRAATFVYKGKRGVAANVKVLRHPVQQPYLTTAIICYKRGLF